MATDNLTLFVGGATGDGTFDRLDPTAAPAQSLERWGVPPQTPQVPDLTLSLGLDFNSETSFGDLGFGLDYYWTDEYVIAANPGIRAHRLAPAERLPGTGLQGQLGTALVRQESAGQGDEPNRRPGVDQPDLPAAAGIYARPALPHVAALKRGFSRATCTSKAPALKRALSYGKLSRRKII